MYKKITGALYMLNITFQAIYSLCLPIGIFALSAFLLTRYASFPDWVWVPLLLIGVFTGLYSMIKYVLTAMKNLGNLEKEQKKREEEKRQKEERQSALRQMAEERKKDQNE